MARTTGRTMTRTIRTTTSTDPWAVAFAVLFQALRVVESGMRIAGLMLLAGLVASPAAAAPDTSSVEQALRDPATAERIDRSMKALTDALLDLKVGELQAAVEGREATPADRALTVRELERRGGGDPEAIRRQIRDAGPAIAKGMNALASALPAMTGAMEELEKALDKMSANLPDPTYPKR